MLSFFRCHLKDCICLQVCFPLAHDSSAFPFLCAFCLAKKGKHNPRRSNSLSSTGNTEIPKSLNPLLLAQTRAFYENGYYDLCMTSFLGSWRWRGLTDRGCERSNLHLKEKVCFIIEGRTCTAIPKETEEAQTLLIATKETKNESVKGNSWRPTRGEKDLLEEETKEKCKCGTREWRCPPFHTSPEISNF